MFSPMLGIPKEKQIFLFLLPSLLPPLFLFFHTRLQQSIAQGILELTM